MNDDWRGWKKGKYDNRYRGVKRHSGKRNYWKAVAIIIPISVLAILLLVVPIQGFNAIKNFVSQSPTISNLPKLLESAPTGSNPVPNNALKAIPNNILTEDAYYAQLVPSNIKVVDKGRYNMISLTVTINVKNFPIDGNVQFEDLYTTLKDENGKEYKPDSAECKMSDFIPVIGKQTDSVDYTVCYSADRSLNKFSILYTEPLFNYHVTRIGYLDFNTGLVDYYKSHRSSEPHQIGTIDLTK